MVEIIVRASKNQAFANVIRENGKSLDKAITAEFDEDATTQESALSMVADLLSQVEGHDVTIYGGDGVRIRILQIMKYLKEGADTADVADKVQSKFTDTMRPLTTGEHNAITALAEALSDKIVEGKKIVAKNVRQLLHVQLKGDADELESLVGKMVELINIEDGNGRKQAVVKGHESIVSENNAFGVGGDRTFKVQKWSKGYSIERAVDPHADKAYSQLSESEKADYHGINLIRVLCDKELSELMPKSEAIIRTTVSSIKELLAA